MPLTRRLRALLLLVMLTASAPAAATVTCSATMTNVSFGTVDPLGALVNTTATINYQCTYSAGVLGNLYGVFARLCFSVGTGMQGSTVVPRQMTNPSGDTMNYQLYRDAARTQVLGSVDTPGVSPIGADVYFTILGVGTTQTGTATVYGQVPAGQTGLGVGTYGSAFTGANTKLSFRYNEALLSLGVFPPDCGTANNGTFAFNAGALVVPACTVGAGLHDFGGVSGLLAGNTDATSAISLRCTYRAPWQVGLDNGQNASGQVRRMTGPGGLVTYELYRNTTRSQRWGNTLNTDTFTGTGTGTTQNLTVYGRVPAQSPRAAGVYTDTIVVTVTY